MGAIDRFALEIGHMVIGLAIFAFVIWLYGQSRVFAWFLKVSLLLLWGLATVGVTLFVIAVIHLPRGHYWAAFFTLIFGGLMSIFWFAFGLPSLLQSFKKSQKSSTQSSNDKPAVSSTAEPDSAVTDNKIFVVKVSDNFHYMDESETYTHGEFATWAEAVAAARGIVDRCLAEYHQPGITAEALFSQYTSFGDDPLIVPTPVGEKFSGWDYAKERCTDLCRQPEPRPVRVGADGKPAIGPFVRQMARWHEVTPEEYAERIGGEPEGLILEPGEDEPVEWLHDRVRRSPGNDLVLVEGPDGFKALRVLGRWTNQPPFKFTFGDADNLVEVAPGSFEHATIAREARLALSKSGVSREP